MTSPNAYTYAAKLDTVPCDICCKPTKMIATRRCDRCWELERRIEHDIYLAEEIIERLKSNK